MIMNMKTTVTFVTFQILMCSVYVQSKVAERCMIMNMKTTVTFVTFQILMCSVYGVCKVVERDIRFKAIVNEYRNLPTAQADVRMFLC